MLCRVRRRFRWVFWLWQFWRSEWFRQQGKPGLRHMIRPFRFVCTSSPGEEALTRIAPSLRWPNARCRLPAARPSATLTRITRAQQRRWDESTGGIAASIELIQLDSLACPQPNHRIYRRGGIAFTGYVGARGETFGSTRKSSSTATPPLASVQQLFIAISTPV